MRTVSAPFSKVCLVTGFVFRLFLGAFNVLEFAVPTGPANQLLTSDDVIFL